MIQVTSGQISLFPIRLQIFEQQLNDDDKNQNRWFRNDHFIRLDMIDAVNNLMGSAIKRKSQGNRKKNARY